MKGILIFLSLQYATSTERHPWQLAQVLPDMINTHSLSIYFKVMLIIFCFEFSWNYSMAVKNLLANLQIYQFYNRLVVAVATLLYSFLSSLWDWKRCLWLWKCQEDCAYVVCFCLNRGRCFGVVRGQGNCDPTGKKWSVRKYIPTCHVTKSAATRIGLPIAKGKKMNVFLKGWHDNSLLNTSS